MNQKEFHEIDDFSVGKFLLELRSFALFLSFPLVVVNKLA